MKKLAVCLVFLFGFSLSAFDLGGMASTMMSATNTQNQQQSSLTDTLSSELGISKSQASGGVGSILSYAKSSLSGSDYSTLASGIGNSSSFLSAAPSTSKSGYSGLVSQFSSLGLSSSMIQKFVPIIVGYLTKSGSMGASGILTKLFQ
jgi:hypothetical protein